MTTPTTSSLTDALKPVAMSINISNVNFEVVQGSLMDEQTDAIVNPTDVNLKLRGSLSKAILSKGGVEIAKECRLINNISENGAVITTGGTLNCRFIVHVISPENLKECEQSLLAAIREASKKQCHSISIPPIGTGRGRLSLHTVTRCIVETLVSASLVHDIGGITLVRLVGFNTIETKYFEKALSSLRNLNNIVAGTSRMTQHTINGVQIAVVNGDITTEKVDAIVNPTNRQLAFDGALSKAIIAKGGHSIVTECQKIGTLQDVAITSAGSLPCRHIVHVLSPDGIKECHAAVKDILRLCVKKQLVSIAMPPIGLSKGMPLKNVAASMLDTLVLEAVKGLETIASIRLVGNNTEETAAFTTVLNNIIGSEQSIAQFHSAKTSAHAPSYTCIPVQAALAPASSSPPPLATRVATPHARSPTNCSSSSMANSKGHLKISMVTRLTTEATTGQPPIDSSVVPSVPPISPVLLDATEWQTLQAPPQTDFPLDPSAPPMSLVPLITIGGPTQQLPQLDLPLVQTASPMDFPLDPSAPPMSLVPLIANGGPTPQTPSLDDNPSIAAIQLPMCCRRQQQIQLSTC